MTMTEIIQKRIMQEYELEDAIFADIMKELAETRQFIDFVEENCLKDYIHDMIAEFMQERVASYDIVYYVTRNIKNLYFYMNR